MASSFFDKLKKGMGIEATQEIAKEELKKEPKEEEKPKEKKEKPKEKKSKKIEKKKIKADEQKEPEVKYEVKPEVKEEKVPEEKTVKEEEKPKIETKKEGWFEPEGELAIDIYQIADDLVIQSAIAGVKSEDLDIVIEGDIITITGERRKPTEEGGDYFSQECFWGRFSKQLILPVEIDPNRIEAKLQEGVLTIRMPKISRDKKRKISVRA